MNKEMFEELYMSQKKYFNNNKTLSYEMRKESLKKLYITIKKYENEITDALYDDLGKSKTESYMCEIGMVLSELNYQIKHLKKNMKIKKVKTPLAQFRSNSFIKPSPYGQVLVISPWNYPFLLSLDPLIEAVAAGNTVILKMSRFSQNTSLIIKKIIDEVFLPVHVTVILGGLINNDYLINKKWDYIFFTGSKEVGTIIYEAAAKNLTPVTLELGGKSPCIIDDTANIMLACRRIIFGKLLNCGQTCVAPDYLFVHKNVKKQVIEELIKQINIQYPDILNNKNYGHIINKKHFDRLLSLINNDKVIYGGGYIEEKRKIEATIMDNISKDDACMQEEIFGPLIPIMEYENIDDVINYINSNGYPLALYYFSTNKININKVLNEARFGGGCINDTIIHLATENMPFGGFGDSGLGGYHGKFGFNTFTHYKSIVDKKNSIDLPMRYQPYKKYKDDLIHKFLK